MAQTSAQIASEATGWSPLMTAAVGLGVGFLLGRSSAPTAASVVAKTASASSPKPSSPIALEFKEEKSAARKEMVPNPVFAQLAKKMTLDDISWAGKRVLVRVDYNVPVANGVVTDANRIETTIPTITRLLAGKPKCIVLLAHWGQPVGNYSRDEFTLAPAAKCLQGLLPNTKVVFLTDCVGPEVEDKVNNCEAGTVFLCENLRFHLEEIGSGEDDKKNKIKASAADIATFRKQLMRLGDVFVFEAFGASHRPHSSISGIELPQRVSGLLVQKELKFFSQVLSAPSRPFVAILGGAKISDKILVIQNLLKACDHLIIGGGMAYTFKKVAHGIKIGKSLFDVPGAEHVMTILDQARELGVQIHLPDDHVIADSFKDPAHIGITDDASGIPDSWLGMDIGPKSRARFSAVIGQAKTILWNGPMGVFEQGPFAAGTLSVMADMVLATKRGAVTVVGGGDTGSAAEQFYFNDQPCSSQITHVSTGGGSSLVLMEGKDLPGVTWLTEKQ